jgi:hypothetical protein
MAAKGLFIYSKQALPPKHKPSGFLAFRIKKLPGENAVTFPANHAQ